MKKDFQGNMDDDLVCVLQKFAIYSWNQWLRSGAAKLQFSQILLAESFFVISIPHIRKM